MSAKARQRFFLESRGSDPQIHRCEAAGAEFPAKEPLDAATGLFSSRPLQSSREVQLSVAFSFTSFFLAIHSQCLSTGYDPLLRQKPPHDLRLECPALEDELLTVFSIGHHYRRRDHLGYLQNHRCRQWLVGGRRKNDQERIRELWCVLTEIRPWAHTKLGASS